ncbi:UDP-N-acetylmuramate dehydrogenase [Bizionia argentinensis JUB59]|uniref:UDP-N-acetylenolpyruvoylglucosamine reductase n=1 Tax=Bizionia argentinensis JUB59 TaxID=1046627 RepID=G2EBP7_9FLAO|nr:UDP-N-acetylmuramate dehydrogenase [Bizionia argentinensis]EGV44122.1 UDP-N-acetylmuramate dehydrogenase [Bizionia argentinensis JUB59]
MQILNNISLKPYNTFGLEATAKHFVSVNSIASLQKVLVLPDYPKKFILGGGSNMLLTQNIEALVLHINIKGISVILEEENTVNIKASAGENWHEFVLWCLAHNYGGLENLSLIPGNVGTAPIQNIGAYGIELKDSFVSCEALEIATGSIKTFNKAACNFDYRNSIFKQEAKGQYIICSVTFQLTKNHHQLHTNYGAISNQLQKMSIDNPTIQDVSKAVIAIRQSKLPDPKEIGNSGSFFKNPIISTEAYKDLKMQFPNAPGYIISELEVKVPAGWLIEKAGFKGKRFGNYGVHKEQALVLVNYGHANGSDILKLAELIQLTVRRLFNIKIEAEVNLL